MKLKNEEMKALYFIVNSYLKNNNISVYYMNKKGILSRKTLDKILKKTSSTFEEKTLIKIINFPNMNKENKIKIKKIISNHQNKNKIKIKNNSHNNNISELIKKIVYLEKENEKLLNQNLNFFDLKYIKTNNYSENRKIGSFNSDIETRTLLMKKIWEFNDEIFKKWAEVKLLLNINNKKDNIKMKKGLLSIAETFKNIITELEQATFDSSDFNNQNTIEEE